MPPAKQRSTRSPARRDYAAPALEKGIDIIELLAEEETGLTVSEISQQLGRRMSELFRIIVVMERRGWLRKDIDTARYSVTYHVLQLAHRGTPAKSLTVVAAPIMETLSTRINQSCHLVVRSGTRGLVVLRQENQRRHANLSVRLGAVIELPASCSGQILLAHLDPDSRKTVLDSLKRPRKLSRAALESTLDRVRKLGYVLHRSPITAGVTDISYPIRGFDGKVVAALTVPYLHVLDGSVPTTIDQARRLLEEAARRISQSLGFVR
jgi:DNA-binding IclR family transcriptional regulator